MPDPGCRISRVRFKRGGADVTVLLPKVPPGDDLGVVEGLVNILKLARDGQVTAYAVVIVQDVGGAIHTLNSAVCHNDADKMRLLGAMRRMEYRFIETHWS